MLGTAKLRTREKASVHPRGGLLSDEMGLGKTIQMITNIVNSLARDGPEARQGMTLIIVPSNLLHQWENEIEKHVENPTKTLGRYCKYSTSRVEMVLGSNKATRNRAVKCLEKHRLM